MSRITFDDPESFGPGDRVRIIGGSFRLFEGEIESVDEVEERAVILLTIFGRKTPVDADLSQLQKLTD